jgi:galactan endo-1,6-beta-galactosidase
MSEPVRRLGETEKRVIDPRRDVFVWDGWGTCLSWWANTELGKRDDLARVIFGLDRTRVELTDGEADLPGLGLNIARYNLGACTWSEVNGRRMVESPNTVRRKQIEGYWDGGDAWNWDADPNQRAMLHKARDAGADTFEMFSVSPLWWMTVNGNPSGTEHPEDDNLAPEHREAFARYIAVVARRARDEWGVRFASVEPFNEPTMWWRASGTQEGCHFSWAAQAALLPPLRRALDEQGLGDVPIAASDECHYTQAATTWQRLPGGVRRLVGRVNVHGYLRDTNPANRIALREAVGDGMSVWQTEYGEAETDGLTMALNLSRDVRYLRARSWGCWQPVESHDWGLLDGEFDHTTPNPGGGAPGTLKGAVSGVTTKYFVLAQYTRHVRPGARILGSGHANTVAAHDATARRLTLVTVDDGAAQTVHYDLSLFAKAEGAGNDHAVRVWVTDASNDASARRYAREGDAHLNGRALTIAHGPRTVTTMEVDNVQI